MAINPADISTIRVGQLVPKTPTLTDLIPFENDTDLYNCTIQDLIDLLNLNVGAFQYEIKTLYVDQTYIDNNLDASGLGINLLAGWAKVNGNNGTPPMAGLVEVAEGTGYSIGSFGGSKEVTLTIDQIPTHSHSLNGSSSDNGDPGNFVITAPTSGGATNTVATTTQGTGDPHNNMQPYIVVLKIMKL